MPQATASHRCVFQVVLALAGVFFCLYEIDRGEGADGKTASVGNPLPFKVPAGFVVEKVAGAPLVEHPMMACFDERGRLFIAEAAGKNLPYTALLKDPPNFIRVLEAADAQGRFVKGRVFADKMTFPMGVLWHDGALFTAAAPSFWRLQDIHGKGTADKREALVTGFTSVGNGADIHGPFLGPDGRLYWTKGRHPFDIKSGNGKGLKGLASRVFRCKPDGTDFEVVCGGGMDDPVEIAFTAEGEPLVTVDIFLSAPKRVDAIFYAIEGGAYPHHESYKELKSTGDLLPPVADLGWVAPSGLMRHRSGAFGKEYQGNLFSAQFNTHRIQRHIVERDGATFRLKTEDFLVSSDPDFHPTDVLEDADGSLLIIDTGGWFRIGCPTSRIARPEVKGGIYRVRRKDAPTVADTRGLKLAWDRMTRQDLGRLLDNARFMVRDRAIHFLAKKGVAPGKPLVELGATVRARRNAVWALCRMESEAARAEVRQALDDPDPSVRLAAVHAAGLNRDAKASTRLVALVSAANEPPAIRREAAIGLGRTRPAGASAALFAGLRLGGDRLLEHSLIYALIQNADRTSALQQLRDPSPVIRRAALIALDQMDGGNLTRGLITPLLNTDDPALQKTALGIITAHPAWAREILGFLGKWLNARDLDGARQESLRGALLAFAKEKSVQDLVAQALQRDIPIATRVLLLETIARAPLEKLPAAWIDALGESLARKDEKVVRQAIAGIRAGGVTAFDSKLRALARDEKRPAGLRVAALAAAAPRLEEMDNGLFEFLMRQLGKEAPALARLAAAEALANCRLNEAQMNALAGAIAHAGPLELSHLLAPFERAASATLGQKLVAALAKAPGFSGLTGDTLRRSLKNFPAEIRDAAKPLLQRLEVDSAQQVARLAELRPVLSGGDAKQGRAVFFGTKAACAACHTVQSEGGRIGPDLSKIGSIRAPADLLESIVFPSASFVRGYEPYVIETRDGKEHAGIIARETADAVYLRTIDRAEVRIARSSVEAIRRGKVSIMPQALDAQLSRRELGDLIAFLQALK